MRIKQVILSLILIAGFFLNTQYASALPPKLNLAPSDYTNGLTWEKAQKLNKPIVLNFYVDWCHFCQGFAPILYLIRQQYESKYSFVYVNCEDKKNESLVKTYKVQSYPTLYLVDKKRNKKVLLDNSKFNNIQLLTQDLDKFLK